jgi:hypothetical protein
MPTGCKKYGMFHKYCDGDDDGGHGNNGDDGMVMIIVVME